MHAWCVAINSTYVYRRPTIITGTDVFLPPHHHYSVHAFARGVCPVIAVACGPTVMSLHHSSPPTVRQGVVGICLEAFARGC